MKPITLYLDNDGDKTWTDPQTGQVYQMCKAPAFDVNSKAFREARNQDEERYDAFAWLWLKSGQAVVAEPKS
jgi:hypothetical protein